VAGRADIGTNVSMAATSEAVELSTFKRKPKVS
jgi:hypothetical protein